MEQLSDTQARVLAAVRRRVERGETSPSYRGLCKEFGWRSTGTVRDHLRALAQKGYVSLPGGRGGRVMLRTGIAPVANIPVMGRVRAGVPAVSDEQIEGTLPVPASWADSGEHFALRVSGDSMTGAGILDGDHVVVRKRSSARPGDIVAVTVDGETTLKRLEKAGGRMMLIAANPRYRPIEVRSEAVAVHGVVVGLLRNYGNGRVGRQAQRLSIRT